MRPTVSTVAEHPAVPEKSAARLTTSDWVPGTRCRRANGFMAGSGMVPTTWLVVVSMTATAPFWVAW